MSRIRNKWRITPSVKAMNCKLLVLYLRSLTGYPNRFEIKLFIKEYTHMLAIKTVIGDYEETVTYLVNITEKYIDRELTRKDREP